MSEDTTPPRTPPHQAIELRDSTEEESWLLVYLDVMTLLVVMFVVMLTFAGDGDPETAAETTEPAPQAEGASPQADWPTVSLGENIEASRSDEGLRLRISSGLLFESGQAELSQKGLVTLAELVPTLQQSSHPIVVTGHTDDVPITTERYPSNWELSSARAAQVVRFFQKEGIRPERMTAVGKAHIEPRASNESPEGRARNRRVELLLRLQRDDGPRVRLLPVD